MADLRIGNGVVLPIDTVTQSIAILARRGAGKTYTASVIVEEAIGAQVPVVILDPTGAWWGLRSSVDGEKPGLPVVIFGGDHGDMDLDHTAGSTFADVVLEHPGAYIFDLSAFTTKAAEYTFAAAFLDRLYRGKKPESGPLFVVVDEADVFAPQQPRDKGDQLKSLGALESIVRRGRIKGLGCLLITQRAAVLNKNVLTQTEILVVMQTTGPQDRAAIDEWIRGNGTDEQREYVLSTLAALQQGEAWLWSPSFLRTLVRIRIRARKTFDSSRTPGAGEVAIAPTTFAKVDLEQLDARIAAAKAEQKANDPKELRRRIAELERQLTARPTEQVERTVEKVVEVPVLDPLVVSELSRAVGQMLGFGESIAKGAEILARDLNLAIAAKGGQSHAPRPQIAAQPVQKAPVVQSERSIARQPVISLPEGEIRLGKAERTILAALATQPAGLTRIQLSLISGYSIKSSSYANALGALRSAGLVSGNPIQATPEGLALAGDVEPMPRPGEELLAYWLANPNLGKAERALLSVLADAYPREMDKAEVAALSGYSATSSSFANALGRLRSLGLVSGWRASDELMGG